MSNRKELSEEKRQAITNAVMLGYVLSSQDSIGTEDKLSMFRIMIAISQAIFAGISVKATDAEIAFETASLLADLHQSVAAKDLVKESEKIVNEVEKDPRIALVRTCLAWALQQCDGDIRFIAEDIANQHKEKFAHLGPAAVIESLLAGHAYLTNRLDIDIKRECEKLAGEIINAYRLGNDYLVYHNYTRYGPDDPSRKQP